MALELFQSVPYGKRAILVAKQKNVDELFNAVSYLIDRRSYAEDMRRKTTQRKEVMGANKNPYDKTYLKGRTLNLFIIGKMSTLGMVP